MLTVLLVVSAIAAAAAGGWYHSDGQVARRGLRRGRAVPIVSLTDGGPTRVIGRVEADALLTGPVSGQPCVCYEVSVELLGWDGARHEWQELFREHAAVPFAIRDDSGRLLIDPTDARYRLVVTGLTDPRNFGDASPFEREMLDRHRIVLRNLTDAHAFRYHESRIGPGDQISVTGVPIREPDPDAADRPLAYREAAPSRLRLRATSGTPMWISDRPDSLDETW